jgi:hypothetical protein
MQRLAAGEPGPEIRFARHVGDAPVRLGWACLGVHTEDLDTAGTGPDHPE